VNVVVLDFDDDKKRISLGMKQLTKHPWDEMMETLNIGDTIEGRVVNVEDYGAFLELTPGVEGLVHVSEISWSNQPVNSREFFKVGETHSAKIMTIDNDERKMSLSIKHLQEDPWGSIAEKFAKGSKHSGLVKNITAYGVFVELAEGIGGMVHISDLSWTKRYGHPSEFTSAGKDIEVVILEIDNEARKITLGHKQIEEDPWDTFENVFPVGSIHEATVIKRDEKGAEVALPYGLEAFAPTRHAKKEDGSIIDIDHKYEFKVIEFDRNDKRILVSHTRVWEEKKSEEKAAEHDEKKAEAIKTKKAVQKLNSSTDKSTLGDLDALQSLKEQMDKNEN
jgi:small subunit ribosomal protein S1